MRRLVSTVALAIAITVGANAAFVDAPVADAAARGDREAVKSLL
jgi:hypothetical protein